MTIKLSGGLIILFIALALQFWFASMGVYINLSFAALISFAFLFGFWELLALILIAVFIVNWQPAASLEILIFAMFPIAAHFSRDMLHWQPWMENLLAIPIGFLVLHLAVVSGNIPSVAFLINLGAGLALGAGIFFVLNRS